MIIFLRSKSFAIIVLAMSLLSLPVRASALTQNAAFDSCMKVMAQDLKAWKQNGSYWNSVTQPCVQWKTNSYLLEVHVYSSLYGWRYDQSHWDFVLPTSTNAVAAQNRGVVSAGHPVVSYADPISAGMGNKYLIKHEFAGNGPFPLDFSWTYNSNGAGLNLSPQSFALGMNRLHSYARWVTVNVWTGLTQASVTRPDGNVDKYTLSGSAWVAGADNASQLTSVLDGAGTLLATSAAMRAVKSSSTEPLVNSRESSIARALLRI